MHLHGEYQRVSYVHFVSLLYGKGEAHIRLNKLIRLEEMDV